MEKVNKLSFCLPHAKVSRPVQTKKDEEVIDATWESMQKLCHLTWGLHRGAYAIAHSQVDDQDPLRFFVTMRGDIIVNPEIIRKTKIPVAKTEGCMTFPEKASTMVMRSHKCEVEFYKYVPGTGMQGPFTEAVSGVNAQVMQHEIGHMNGEYIFSYEQK